MTIRDVFHFSYRHKALRYEKLCEWGCDYDNSRSRSFEPALHEMEASEFPIQRLILAAAKLEAGLWVKTSGPRLTYYLRLSLICLSLIYFNFCAE
jgi:hypothetical protein